VKLETSTVEGIKDESSNSSAAVEAEEKKSREVDQDEKRAKLLRRSSSAGDGGLIIDTKLEKMMALLFCHKDIILPATVHDLIEVLEQKQKDSRVSKSAVMAILEKLEAQDFLNIKRRDSKITILDCEYVKLDAVYGDHERDSDGEGDSSKRKREGDVSDAGAARKKDKKAEKTDSHKDTIESLLSMPTMKEVENKKLGEEILDLLNQPTAKEQSLMEKFKSEGGAMVREFCPYGTKEECKVNNADKSRCKKLHFRKILQSHTDETLGDCSFLNTCFHMDTCKYVHYEVDTRGANDGQQLLGVKKKKTDLSGQKITLIDPQWIQCDVRYIDFDVLGKFSVVMADPPWDIHMELPYGTMADHEMKSMAVQKLQDHGYIFLWVTGRAIELGRECLEIWGYKRIDELIWVKTNQLQRLIRTGRTGHWINHGKEHCLVGMKGNPSSGSYNRGLDCDVLVSEVRDTSHKPDEVYGIIERLAPGQRKIELFGRQHNVQPNWITLGNQLAGVHLCDPEVVKRFRDKYPDGVCAKPKPTQAPTVIELTPSSNGADLNLPPT